MTSGASCTFRAKLFVDLQGALLQELRGEQRGVGNRHDLVIVSVHDEGRYVDHLQVLGESVSGTP